MNNFSKIGSAVCITSFFLVSCSGQVPIVSSSGNEPFAAESGYSVDAASSVLQARYVPERNDDFAWENDLVAFRAYGPVARPNTENSGYDCWLKSVKYPIIDKWYRLALEEGLSYHEDRGEGYDPYHVGASAGCGASALWLNGKREPLETFVSWTEPVIDDEKLQFTLGYSREIDGHTYAESRSITLFKGHRLFKVDSVFYKDGEPAPNLDICVGLITHNEAAELSFNDKERWMSAWENIHGFGLGTAVLLSPGFSMTPKVIPTDINDRDIAHGLILSQTDAQGQFSYFAGYGWEKAGDILNEGQWQDYLSEFGRSKQY